jgi:hypothetical protein
MHIINLEKYQTLNELKEAIQTSLEKESFCLVLNDGELVCSVFSPEIAKNFLRERMVAKIVEHPKILDVLDSLINKNITKEDNE